MELINSHFKNIIVRNYIAEPPTIAELEDVLQKMNQKPEYILRKKDPVFQELFEGKKLTPKQMIKAMRKHPSIIERPIIIIGNKAHLGRPFNEFAETLIADLKKQ